MPQQKKVSRAGPPTVARMVEDIVGCKWSLAVLGAIRRGVCRPGAIERAVTGISTKVLNERLRKLQRFGLIERQAYAELRQEVTLLRRDFQNSGAGIHKDIDVTDTGLRKDTETMGAGLRKDMDTLSASFRKDLELQGTALTVRLGSMLAVLPGLLFAARKLT
jgi:DNA-binding HxlR family transcriptional regulator